MHHYPKSARWIEASCSCEVAFSSAASITHLLASRRTFLSRISFSCSRRTLQRSFAANNFRDVRNERIWSQHRHNPTTVLISRMDRKPKHDWSLLVPCVLIAISLLGFVYLVWDRLQAVSGLLSLAHDMSGRIRKVICPLCGRRE